MTGHMLLTTREALPTSRPAPLHKVNLHSCISTAYKPLSLAVPPSVSHRRFHSCPSPYLLTPRAPSALITSHVFYASPSESEQHHDSGFSRKRLAAFVSGGGSNFKTLHEASLSNKILGDIVLVISDKPGCKACEYAIHNNIPVIEYPRSKSTNSGLSPSELVNALREHEVDFVLLAGYLKLLPKEVVQAYPRAILNIHPALLPAFGGKGYYGRKVHEAVIKSGARFSGPTVHFVDEKYDHGSIVAQRILRVLAYDTPDDLAARVLKEEHTLYSEVVAAICEDRIFWREDGVPLIRRSSDVAEYD